MEFSSNRVENIVGKGENAGYQHFLLFPQCFQKTYVFMIIKSKDCFVKGWAMYKLLLFTHVEIQRWTAFRRDIFWWTIIMELIYFGEQETAFHDLDNILRIQFNLKTFLFRVKVEDDILRYELCSLKKRGLNPLPDNKIVDWSKLKQSADNIL